LDVNGRHLGFTFLIDRMTEVPTPNIYRAHCPAVPVVGDKDLLLIFCPAAGHFHVFFIPAPGNLSHIFENCQKSGGWPGGDGHAWI
jgi:hypothetical protein